MNGFTIDWNAFQLKYFNQETIFLMEDDKSWVFYTQDGEFYIKCVVMKDLEDDTNNVMFVEKNIQGAQNIVRPLKEHGFEKTKPKQEASDELNEEGIRTEDKELLVKETFTTANDNDIIKKQMEQEDDKDQ